MLLVPNSNGEDNSPAHHLREFNHCHNPSGPNGGEFCSAPDAGGGGGPVHQPMERHRGGGSGGGARHIETVAEAKARLIREAHVEAERKYAQELAEADVAVQQALADGDTKSRYSNPDGSYTAERQALHQRIIQRFFEDHLKEFGKLPPEGLTQPVATFMAGMPGSGKSTAAKDLKNGDVVHIDPDTMKAYFKEYADGLGATVVQRESGDLADALLAMAVSKRMNIVIDGTMKTSGTASPTMSDGALGKMANMRMAGYRVEVRYIDATVAQSLTSVVERFVKQYHEKGFGRYVPPSFTKGLADPDYGTKPRRSFEIVKKTSFDGKPLVDAWAEYAFRGGIVDSNGTLSHNGAGK